jgi:hypothetical protein
MWVYFAEVAERVSAWQEEAGIEVVVATPADMSRWLSDGTFDHALHVAAIFLAIRAGRTKL